jgi:uncharacterized protein YbjQ (UPF0145 family)
MQHDGPTRDQAHDAAESQAALEHGDLPLEARRRLAQESGARPLFATDLSVDEFLLARALGYESVGLVLGSSIYHVGWQFTSSYSSGVLSTVTHAHLHARHLAMGRIQQEAQALGAHGVVGVRLTVKDHDLGSGTLEFTAIGTAVRLRGAPPSSRPFMSDLSGEDFWTLLQAGYVPVGLAMGYCAYLSESMRRVSWNRQNWEVTNYNRAIYQARHIAMQGIQTDLRGLGAHGVVGVKVETKLHSHEYDRGNSNYYYALQVDFLAVGTAVVETHQAASPPTPTLIMNMTSLKPMRSALAKAVLRH